MEPFRTLPSDLSSLSERNCLNKRLEFLADLDGPGSSELGLTMTSSISNETIKVLI